MVAVLMTVVSIRMVEQTGQNHGTTGGATCRRAKRVCEANPLGRQGVQVRRLNGIIAVTAKIGLRSSVTKRMMLGRAGVSKRSSEVWQ